MNIKWIIEERAAILQSRVNPLASDKTIGNLVEEGFEVVVSVADYDFNLSWKVGSSVSIRHYQCTLGEYPEATGWELQHLNEFFLYEIAHGRNVALWCENTSVAKAILDSAGRFFNLNGNTLSEFVQMKLDSQPDRAKEIPKELTHCKACKDKRCITDLMSHVSSVADAEKILRTGAILSATKARQRTGKELALENRNAAGDPPDYFEYVMFTFGNCTAGDRLVLERALGASPTHEELTKEFSPGVRFYFRYKDLISHPGFRSDGYHYCKIKDALELEPYLVAVVAPETASDELLVASSAEVRRHLVFIDPTAYRDLWSWSSRAYQVAKEHEKNKAR